MHLYHRTSFRIYFALFLVFVCTAMPFSAYSEAPASVHLIGEKRTPYVEATKLKFISYPGGQAIKPAQAQVKLVRYLDVASDALGFTVKLNFIKSTPYRDSNGVVPFSLSTATASYAGVMVVGDKSTAGRELNAEEQEAISQEPLTDLEIVLEKGDAQETVAKMKGGQIV
ncbi:hypothetical protein DFJ43DRAFT_1076753, partial [Lentinula guzmanii]